MKDNLLLKDALHLCERILESKNPEERWGIINLVKSDKIKNDNYFYSEKFPQIPRGYYYFFDEVPEYLLSENVLCGVDNTQSWYLSKGQSDSLTVRPEDFPHLVDLENTHLSLTEIATRKGWINKNIDDDTLFRLNNGYLPEYPLDVFIRGFLPIEGCFHLVALFDRQIMEDFVAKKTVIASAEPVNGSSVLEIVEKQEGQYILFGFPFGNLKFRNHENKITLAYFRMLLERNGDVVANSEVEETLKCTSVQRKNALTSLRKRISDNSFGRNLVLFTNRTGAYGIQIFPSERKFECVIRANLPTANP